MRWSALLVCLKMAGCSQSKTECDCADPGAHVHVLPESAAEVTEVRLSGPACSGQKPTCTQAAAVGCATYGIVASAAGSCQIDVVFVDTTFTATVTFAQGDSCCTGLYPTPANAGEIEATPGPSDGGAG